MDYLLFFLYHMFNFLATYKLEILPVLTGIGTLIAFYIKHPEFAIYIATHMNKFYLILRLKYGKTKAKLIVLLSKIGTQFYPLVNSLYNKIKSRFKKGTDK